MSRAVAKAEPPLRFRILNWIAIIDQLAGTRANRRLQRLDLPLPQFVLLTHFSARPGRQQTLTALARAMQQPQPATTKTVQKLVAAGLHDNPVPVADFVGVTTAAASAGSLAAEPDPAALDPVAGGGVGAAEPVSFFSLELFPHATSASTIIPDDTLDWRNMRAHHPISTPPTDATRGASRSRAGRPLRGPAAYGSRRRA